MECLRAFTAWAYVPDSWEILGPDRPVVVVHTSSEEIYDVHSLGGTMLSGIAGSITSGEVYGSYGLTQTYQVFKADGVTPAPISTTPLLASALEPSSLVLIIPGIVAVYFGSRKRIFHAKANQ
jgi:hypothetical protein